MFKAIYYCFPQLLHTWMAEPKKEEGENMNEEFLKIFAYSIPVILIVVLVLSIILFVNRKKIIAKYDVGYISSFFFAAYMLTPLTLGVPALLSNSEEAEVSPIISLVYPIIGLIIFLIVYRKHSLQYKFGKFFAMLGIGICSAFIVVFKMLSFFHRFEDGSPESTSAGNSSNSEASQVKKAKSLYDANGKYRGRINEYGEKYDENGKYQGRINEYGEIYNADGKYTGRINEYGEKYDSNGKYRGKINEYGENYDENGKYTGRSSDY